MRAPAVTLSLGTMNSIGIERIEMPGVGTVRRVEARRKDGAVRKSAWRRHWPRLRVVAEQFVMCVEK